VADHLRGGLTALPFFGLLIRCKATSHQRAGKKFFEVFGPRGVWVQAPFCSVP
jgi:hypothetical protein